VRNQRTKLTRAATLSSQSYELDITNAAGQYNEAKSSKEENTTANYCRLRSRSLKAATSSTISTHSSSIDPKKAAVRNEKMFSSYRQQAATSSFNQFRPVSEHFDFNIDEPDIYMTRSVIVYESGDQSSNKLAEAAFLAQLDDASATESSVLVASQPEREDMEESAWIRDSDETKVEDEIEDTDSSSATCLTINSTQPLPFDQNQQFVE
jgi:hypothetical protein